MLRREDQPVLSIITGHWLSVTGAGLVTTSVICWLLALPSQLRGHVSNPYIGILLFIILPAVFLGGLVLIPVGVYLARRKVLDRPTSIRRLAAARRNALHRPIVLTEDDAGYPGAVLYGRTPVRGAGCKCLELREVSCCETWMRQVDRAIQYCHANARITQRLGPKFSKSGNFHSAPRC